jgi:hypothetical protein
MILFILGESDLYQVVDNIFFVYTDYIIKFFFIQKVTYLEALFLTESHKLLLRSPGERVEEEGMVSQVLGTLHSNCKTRVRGKNPEKPQHQQHLSINKIHNGKGKRWFHPLPGLENNKEHW